MKIKHVHILLIAAIFTLFAAYNSKGVHHPDEHFQIIEFAGLKLGLTTPEALPWEYQAQIRPTLQPYIAYVLISVFRLLGISSPFTQIFLIRLLTGALVLFTLYYFAETLKQRLNPKYHTAFFFLSYFLYFIPYLSVRFSSETMSAVCFMLGLSFSLRLLEKKENENLGSWAIVGFILGLSYLFRFQSIFLLGGLGIWLLFMQRLALKPIFVLVATALLAIAFGSLLDYSFYNDWTFTSWNYIKAFIEGKPDRFGVSPWDFYINDLYNFGKLTYINIPILVITILYILIYPKDFIGFCIIPFIVVHSMIGHKELRFIFPIFFLFSWVIVAVWAKASDFFAQNNWIQTTMAAQNPIISKLLRVALILIITGLFILDIVPYWVNITKPADMQPLVYEYLYNNAKIIGHSPIYSIHEDGAFYYDKKSLALNFYKHNTYNIQTVSPDSIVYLPPKAWLIGHAEGLDTLANSLHVVHAFLPTMIRKWDLGKWMRITNQDWTLYQKK